MKTFVVAICIFALLIGMIVCSSFFVNRTMDTMNEALTDLPSCDAAEAALSELEAYWEGRHALLACSLSFDEMNQMNVCLAVMRAAIEQESPLQFETGRLLALQAAKDMRRLERLSFECIL